MLPTVGADSIKVFRYAAEVSGRIMGIAVMNNLIPDATRRAELVECANAILSPTRALNAAYVARSQFEDLEQRITFGKGKGIDRGFDAIVANVSESVRTSLPDRTPQNPEYRAIFPHGTEEYTSPTIREDEQLATELRAAIQASNITVKNDALALLDAVIPIVGPAATALTESEKQCNALFQAEINARKAVVDALWEQRKNVEATLGRGGKGVARFIFFDFRKGGETDASAPATPPPESPAPKDGP